MLLNIIPITSTSTVTDIAANFSAIQTAINNKQLSFHYLNLYTLKGSVVANVTAIKNAYNLLNLNEALLIVVDESGEDPISEVALRQEIFNAGDYLVKTASGPIKVAGPTTGYYVPSLVDGMLSFTYTNEIPDPEVVIADNIRGDAGKGYALQYEMEAGTSRTFNTIFDDDIAIEPIVEIYHDGDLIDYPYFLTPGAGEQTLTLGDDWTNEVFNVRIR